MTLLEAIPARHSVRAYTDRPIPPEAAEQLRAELQAGNQAGGLHMQLVTDDPAAFDGLPVDREPYRLKLTGVTPYENGAVWLRYVVK